MESPGLGDINPAHKATTDTILAQASAALLVVDAGLPLGQVEQACLQKLPAQIRRTLIVINKVDLLEPAERTAVVRFVKDQVAKLDLTPEPEIYALCAYDAFWLAALTYISNDYPIEVGKFMAGFVRQANDYFGVTGWTTLNSSGDREFATYDFWGIIQNGSDFDWEVRARYDNNTKVLTRY